MVGLKRRIGGFAAAARLPSFAASFRHLGPLAARKSAGLPRDARALAGSIPPSPTKHKNAAKAAFGVWLIYYKMIQCTPLG